LPKRPAITVNYRLEKKRNEETPQSPSTSQILKKRGNGRAVSGGLIFKEEAKKRQRKKRSSSTLLLKGKDPEPGQLLIGTWRSVLVPNRYAVHQLDKVPKKSRVKSLGPTMKKASKNLKENQ